MIPSILGILFTQFEIVLLINSHSWKYIINQERQGHIHCWIFLEVFFKSDIVIWEILIEQALDRFENVKSTKGNKKTIFKAPTELLEILEKWKIKQQEELKLFGLRQTQKQFVFTYNDRTNNINLPLHTDYLNYRMKSVRKRHPELSPVSPHKLRHTGATLAKQAGVSLKTISEALTHSDKQITKTYVNTTDTVKKTVGEIAFRNLKYDSGKF